MAEERRGARLRMPRRLRRSTAEPAVADHLTVGPASAPRNRQVRLDRPNQGPPPEGPVMRLSDFTPQAVAERKQREAEAEQQDSEEVL